MRREFLRPGLMTVTAKGLLAVAMRPALWPTALNEGRALLPMDWWRRWPPALRPPPDYLAFRTQTMYGTPDATVGPEELVRYLEWCRWMRARAR